MNTDGKKINFNSVPLQGLEIDSNLNFDKHISKHVIKVRSCHAEVFLVKGVLKICSKFTEEHPYRSVISIKLDGCLRKVQAS